jgi:RHS repeat-associated protein
MRTYTYDSLNRLATMSSPSDASGCYGLSWTYDRYGNRTAQNATSGNCLQPQTPVSLSNNNRLQPPYQYDASGNMTADASHTYFYDAESRLIQVGGTLGNCSTATACYVYDAEGQRLEKITGGTTTAYLRNSKGEVVAETDGGNTLLRAGYVYVGSALLAEYENGTTNFVLKDYLGDTRVMTGVNGSICDSIDYLPYGEQIAGGSCTTHKFTGKERDAESGLDDFDARYYSSNLGRFVSADWSATPGPVPYADFNDPQSLNLYTYVRNVPTVKVDPDGHCDWCQRLGNWLSFKGWNTDKEIEQQQAEAETREGQEAYNDYNWLINHGGTKDQLSRLDNQQIIGLYNAVQQGNDSYGGIKLNYVALAQNVTDALKYITRGVKVPGTRNQRTFENRGNPLPTHDANGNPIKYQEWDVNVKQPNMRRDSERIVTGSDGSVWYTNGHYGAGTFTQVK